MFCGPACASSTKRIKSPFVSVTSFLRVNPFPPSPPLPPRLKCPDSVPSADELVPAVYNELRRLAAAYMRRERPGQTLQATALVHEAFMRLAGTGQPWTDRKHFLAIAARSMRQILVERARARGAQKRWAGLDRVSLT